MVTPLVMPRLCRDMGNRVVGGVAAGIAAHVGASKMAVRLLFVLLATLGGMGALLYAAYWAVLPSSVSPQEAKGRKTGQLIPFIALGLGVFMALSLSGASAGIQPVLGWLIALVALGAGVIWHYSDLRVRERLAGTMPQSSWLSMVMERDRTAYLLRFLGGGVLIVTGIIGVVAMLSPVAGISLPSILYGLLFALVALAGVGLALAPVLWRVFSQLRAEREARIREQERAEVAAMIHDQVLHTLALIQRNAGDTKTVLRLARGQERTLRNWLYRSTASPTERFSAGLEQAAAEVEDTYAIAVETVVVGDTEVDERLAALLAATREALVNAARHAKVSSVSLYAEAEPDLIAVFVRDRGVGFDPSNINEDRHGVRGSIIGRMQRHGGKAEIRTEPGEGTEVRLSMPVNRDARRHPEEE
ncbi:MAG: PspC domain-containing protein [Dactylosporangium sp.]|nr:PspC domain-containing protein [Dactylosporangium sp.]NNJ59639.1 PspC domain-containing protein [Dactylosporangium sp.]